MNDNDTSVDLAPPDPDWFGCATTFDGRWMMLAHPDCVTHRNVTLDEPYIGHCVQGAPAVEPQELNCPGCGHRWSHHHWDGCRHAVTSLLVCECNYRGPAAPARQEPRPVPKMNDEQRAAWRHMNAVLDAYRAHTATQEEYEEAWAAWEATIPVAQEPPAPPLWCTAPPGLPAADAAGTGVIDLGIAQAGPTPYDSDDRSARGDGGWSTQVVTAAQEPATNDSYHCPDCGFAHWPHESHGSNPRAQEPADPPWLAVATAVAGNAYTHMYDGDSDVATDVANRLLRAALPILRAGIEGELRERLAAAINAERRFFLTPEPTGWHRGMDLAGHLVRETP